MQNNKEKSQYLPIQKEEYGYVQKTQYHQPDLYHEEVIELDSPYASVVQVGTQVFSFLLLGDQNAGKSTFLHSFTYHFDKNFLAITSILPILTSSFINTRFYFEKEEAKGDYAKIFPSMTPFSPMDEMPFLDTDVARGTFLVTKEDFLFFLDEFSIPAPEELKKETVYVVTQFVEIGGDHLDSIMLHKQLQDNNDPVSLSLAPSLVDILKRSLDLLLQSRKTVYLLNATTLFDSQQDNGLVLKQDALFALLKRLRFLNEIFQDNHQMLFYLSRTPQSAIFSKSNESTSLEVVSKLLRASISLSSPSISSSVSPSSLPSSPTDSVCAFLQSLLQKISEMEKWSHLQIVDVLPSAHINEEDGSLNADQVVNTLVRCFQSKMVHYHKSPDSEVVDQILKCFKKEALDEFIEITQQQHSKEVEFYPIYWISHIVFRDYLLEEDDVSIPHPVLIQKFSEISEKMASAGVLIKYYSSNHSNIRVDFQLPNGTKYSWYPLVDVTETKAGSSEMVVRFPHYVPLYKFVESNFIRNVPTDFWSHGSLDPKYYQNASQELELLRPKLEQEIIDRFRKIFQNINGEDLPAYVDTFFWLVEEWAISARILKKKEKTNNLEIFPHKLRLDSDVLQILISKKYFVPIQDDSETETIVQINVE